jgi:hypothetical protein
MVLNEESGIYGKHLEVGIKLNAIASANVTLTIQVGNKVVFNPTNCYEGRSVVWNFSLKINRSLKHTTLLCDCVLGEGDY